MSKGKDSNKGQNSKKRGQNQTPKTAKEKKQAKRDKKDRKEKEKNPVIFDS